MKWENRGINVVEWANIANFSALDNLVTPSNFSNYSLWRIRTTFEQVVNKNRLRKYAIIGNKQLQKKECGHFEQRSVHQEKTLRNLCGWLERQQGALHSFFWILPT